ncbi:MAG: PIN domain-containing protein [Candidatus Rokuibacteriota bacterium]
MSKVVLDTDVLIDLLRGRVTARALLLRVTEQAVPCCSVISVAEIHAGMRVPERARTIALLDSLVLLDVTPSVAELAGHFKQRERGRPLELADCLIAATAVTEAAALATGNVRDYPMPELTLVPTRA